MQIITSAMDMADITVTITQAVANGARTLEDVENATGAGTRCGRCMGAIEACLQEALAAQAS